MASTEFQGIPSNPTAFAEFRGNLSDSTDQLGFAEFHGTRRNSWNSVEFRGILELFGIPLGSNAIPRGTWAGAKTGGNAVAAVALWEGGTIAFQ